MRRRNLLVLAALAQIQIAAAGTLVGRVDAPAAPERPPVAQRGFLDRIDNPLAPPQNVDARHFMVIVLEGDEKPVAPPAVPWELVGESFARPVIAAPAGAEVTIRNSTKVSRRLVALDGGKDSKLFDAAPLNPKGTKAFRPTEAGKVYDVIDPDAPYFKGTLVVVNTIFVGYVDDNGRYEITEVPDGTYKLRVYVSLSPAVVAGGKQGWIELDNNSVTVKAKGKTELNVKLPANALLPAKK
jgi:hypothetical protein